MRSLQRPVSDSFVRLFRNQRSALACLHPHDADESRHLREKFGVLLRNTGTWVQYRSKDLHCNIHHSQSPLIIVDANEYPPERPADLTEKVTENQALSATHNRRTSEDRLLALRCNHAGGMDREILLAEPVAIWQVRVQVGATSHGQIVNTNLRL